MRYSDIPDISIVAQQAQEIICENTSYIRH